MAKEKTIDYKSTLNLPKTDLKMKANLNQMEPDILRNWEENDLYKRIRQSSKGKTKFILHDGPPYANGHIHLGHCLNKILKDIIVKSKTMSGMDSYYVPGWDCHGLPIEHQVVKKLKSNIKHFRKILDRPDSSDYAVVVRQLSTRKIMTKL